jgi:hypothetical protein
MITLVNGVVDVAIGGVYRWLLRLINTRGYLRRARH